MTDDDFAALYAVHDAYLRYIARRVMWRYPNDLDDVMQTAWLSISTHYAQFTGAAQFKSWATRIVINASIEFTRRRACRAMGRVVTNELPSLAARDNPEATYMITELLERVPQVLRAKYIQGETFAEMATRLQRSESALKSQVHRSLRAAREELEK